MAINVVLTIADETGRTRPITVPLPTSVSPIDALLFAEALIPLIEPLVTGTLKDAQVKVDVPFIGWAHVGTLSDVQEKGLFVFRTLGRFLKKLRLPTFLESKFLPQSRKVNLADADVAAFVTAMTNGIDLTGVGGSGVISPADRRGADLTGIDLASESWG